MTRVLVSALGVLGLQAAAWAQQATPVPGDDRLLDSHTPALPWIAGAGILIMTLIAGFKHPGRTHLD